MKHDSWVGVELRHLAALAAVADEGSFRGAADSLGYVQSAVSQQVAHLERAVGLRLVERFRGSKEVHLTEAGEMLLTHAQEISSRMRAARAALHAHSNGHHGGTLRVGAFQSVATHLLPKILRRLAGLDRDVRIVPVEVQHERALFALVDSGEVDIAFGVLPLEPGPFESWGVLREPWTLLVPADSEWVRSTQPPTIEELAALPLIGLNGGRPAASFEGWFAAQGVTPNIVVRAENETAVRAFVAAGVGAAILPRLALEAPDLATARIDLATLAPARRLALFWHQGRGQDDGFKTFCRLAVDVGLEISVSRPMPRAGGRPPEVVTPAVASMAPRQLPPTAHSM